MDVILDTNIYYALIYAHGGQFASANHFVELVTYLKRTNSNLVIPTLVFDELSAKYKRDLSQYVKDAGDAHQSMTRNMMDDWDEFIAPDIDEQVDMLRAQVTSPAKGFKSQIIDVYQSISTQEVARRGIERIRPASDKGEELRDVMLWLIALELAKKGKLAFISGDGAFQATTPGDLHADLMQDTKTAKVEVLYYPSLSKFITENSLTSEVASSEEITALISFAEIANLAEPSLLKLRTPHGKITSAKVTAANLVGAQKYRVGDDTFYIEVDCTAEADLILETMIYTNTFFTALKQPEQSIYAPASVGFLTALHGVAAPAPSLWGTGSFRLPSKPRTLESIGNVLLQPASGSSNEPTVLQNDYAADLSLKFSLRVKGEEKESLQLEELEILNLTAIQNPGPRPQSSP